MSAPQEVSSTRRLNVLAAAFVVQVAPPVVVNFKTRAALREYSQLASLFTPLNTAQYV